MTLLEAEHARVRRLDPQRRDRPSGLQVGPAGARRALRRRDRPGPVSRDARRVRARQAADRRRGDRLRVPRVRLPRPRVGAVARRASCEQSVDTLAPLRDRDDRSCPKERLPRRSARRSITAASSSRRAACSIPGKYFAGLVAAADRAGADLHEGVRARSIRRQADGRLIVETERGAILTKEVVVATNGYTDGVVPSLRRRVIPIGSYIIATEPLPEELARTLSPTRPGVLRHEELPLLLARVRGPPDDLRRPGELPADGCRPDRRRSCTRACSRSIRSSPATGSTTPGAATSGSRSTGCRTSARKDGITYAMGCCGTGVALMTALGTRGRRVARRRPGAGPRRLPFPLVPAPYEGRPWFLPFVGEWFRLQDRLSRRASPAASGSPRV